MHRLSIKTRIVAMLVCSVAALCVVVFALLQQSYEARIDAAARTSLGGAYGSFHALRSRDATMLAAVLDGVMRTDELRDAFARRDRQELLERTRPINEELSRRYGITHLYFIEPDGRVFLRAHSPEQRGDVLTRPTFASSRRGGGYGVGLELGKTAYALRVVHPLYAAGSTPATAGESPIGYVECAEEIDHFLRAMHDQTQDEVSLVLSKDALDRRAWGDMRSRRGLRDDWSDDARFVIAGTSGHEPAAKVDLSSLRSLPAGGEVLGIQRQSGRTLSRAAFPVTDASGRTSGAVIVTHDLTAVAEQLRRTVFVMSAAAVMIGLLLTGTVILMLDQLVFRRLHRVAETLRDDEGGVTFGGVAEREVADAGDEIARFEDRMAANAEELRFKSMLLDNATDAIVVHEPDGTVVYCNRAAYATRGFTRNEYVARQMDELVTEEHRRLMVARTEALLRQGRAIFESEDVSSDGSAIPVEVHAQVIRMQDRELVASVVRDLRERKKAEALVEQLAYYDPLTGLANRRLFDDRVGMAMAHARRTGQPLLVLFVDVDRLKAVNDTLGHAVGDEIIRIVAGRLSEAIREGDTVARLGGDEFVMVLLDVDPEGVEELVARILREVTEPVTLAGRRLEVTMSAGAALYTNGVESPEHLIRCADIAMYVVKRGGGHGFRLYEEGMGAAVEERFAMETELREAFEARELELHYQPQVSLLDGTIVGAEALLRWTRGGVPVSPAAFIPIAEETGLIVPLGRWVLDEACRQAAAWRDEGLQPLRMSVNLSAMQLLHDDVVSAVREALAVHALEPSLLELEITEGTVLHPSREVQDALTGLRELGVRVAVDDFGVGYSSFSMLRQLSVQTLKIDRSFISGIDIPENHAIVRMIVELSRHLHLHTVVEGVETAEQLAILRAMDCAEAQGFLFSPAVTPPRFAELAAGGPFTAEAPAPA